MSGIVAYWPHMAVLLVFLASSAVVHYRGRVRHPLARQLTDHSTFMGPYNMLMYLFSAVPNRPWVELKHFPELQALSDNWTMIRDEALALYGDGYIRAAKGYNDLGFNSFFRTGWKRFYLKWYDEALPSALELCPRTSALLAELPSVNAAMFALLPPGARLVSHRDPFAGSLRYHLGLSTPNSPDCRIMVDGDPYYWKDGEAVMFDETYIHRAENRTDQARLILFCDIERPLTFGPVRFINRHIGHAFVRAAATQNVDGERVGILNRLFNYLYRIRLLGKRVKAWNETVYYLLKWLLIVGLLVMIFIATT